MILYAARIVVLQLLLSVHLIRAVRINANGCQVIVVWYLEEQTAVINYLLLIWWRGLELRKPL
jgi:hypothetical protein